jgi:hypothetical protein
MLRCVLVEGRITEGKSLQKKQQGKPVVDVTLAQLVLVLLVGKLPADLKNLQRRQRRARQAASLQKP